LDQISGTKVYFGLYFSIEVCPWGHKGGAGGHSQEFWCLLLCRYAAKGSVYVRHCNTELRKQVFPRFCRPAPWNYSQRSYYYWAIG